MDVRLRVPAALRALATTVRATSSFGLDDGATVADLLDAVGAAYPALERRIRDERGGLRPHVNLFIGEDNVRSLDGLGSVLRPGDQLTILAAISGG